MDEVIEREIWKPAFEAGFRLIEATGFDRDLGPLAESLLGIDDLDRSEPLQGPVHEEELDEELHALSL